MPFVLLAFVFHASLCLGSDATVVSRETARPAVQDRAAVRSGLVRVAESRQASEEEAPAPSAEDEKGSPGPKQPKREGAKAAPRKDFVPSERIAADQAVDFPADI